MISIQQGPNWKESIKVPNTAQYLKLYTPPKRNEERRWRIINEDTGEVVDSFTPDPPKPRPKPICKYENSWAATVNLPQPIKKFTGHPTHHDNHLLALRHRVLGKSGYSREEANAVNLLTEDELLEHINCKPMAG